MLPPFLNPYVLLGATALVILAFLGGWLFGSERAHTAAVKAQQVAVAKAVEATKKELTKRHAAAQASAVKAAKAEGERHARIKIVRQDVIKYVPTAAVCTLPPEVIEAINQAGH